MQTSPVISSNYDPFSKWPNLINLSQEIVKDLGLNCDYSAG